MIVVDSNILISLMHADDSCHEKSMAIMKNVDSSEIELSEHVYVEVLTILRNKVSDKEARSFLAFLQLFSIGICHEDAKIYPFANECFFQYKQLSYTDALLLAKAIAQNADLLTFDQNLQKAWKKLKK